MSFQAVQSKSVHWAQPAEAVLLAEEVETALALDVDEATGTTELALALDETTTTADDLAAADDEVMAEDLAAEEITTEEAAEVLAGAAAVVVEGHHPKPKKQKVLLSRWFSASAAWIGAADDIPARPR